MAESSKQERNADRRRAVTRGTANVFADLGFPDAIEHQVRLRLAFDLNQVLSGRELSPFEAAKVLGITQPDGMALRRYKLAGRRTPDEPADSARPGCRDRNSSEAPLAQSCADQRRRGVAMEPV